MMHLLPYSRLEQFRLGAVDASSKSIGKTNEVKDYFYALSVERRITTRFASTIIKYASTSLLAKGIYEYEQK
jgi:hypothetical protein